ncbi:MAG: SDR family oxidoreductase [Tissierellia bacterium]|nr:SDR family oxidoreductase [Tissierellia bacterium]
MSIQIDLKGRAAVVAGGGRGLGQAIALTLAKAGADVFIGNRKEEEGLAVVKEIEALGVKGAYHFLDVAKDETVQEFFKQALQFADNKIDIVVNNAGIIETRAMMDIAGEEAHKVYEVNAMGLANVVRAALKQMIVQEEGKIVTISSIAGISAMGMLEHYSASKYAAVALTKNAAIQAAKYHINVNAVAPGIIRTKMWEEILDMMTDASEETRKRDDTFDNAIKDIVPFGVPQTEQDIANAVLFLVSDLAKEITGQVLAVDGGTTI